MYQKINQLLETQDEDNHFLALQLFISQSALHRYTDTDDIEITIDRSGSFENYIIIINNIIVEYEQVEDDMVYEVDHYIKRYIFAINNGKKILLNGYGKFMNGSGYNLRYRYHLPKARIQGRKTIFKDFSACIPLIIKLLDNKN